jgi:hypothetical protein
VTALVILALLAAAYYLFKARPFKTCTHCKGYGSKTSILGGIKACRHCHGTGLRKRSQRRKARRLLDAPSPRSTRR